MAKKRFGIDQATSEAISQTMKLAMDHDSNFINAEILLSKIELDPDNPRKHLILRKDLENGLEKNDPNYKRKQAEFEGLYELSLSLQKEGLLHPIIVYKDADKYRLVAGERRLFASIIAKKTQIEARVFKHKPKLFDLKLIQWMENDSRKNLTLNEKLMNIAAIIELFQKEEGEKLTAILLSRILCVSRQSGQFYFAIISNTNLMALIQEGKITKLRVARELSSIQSKKEILQVLENIEQSKTNLRKKNISKDKSRTPGRKRSKVTLGNTKNIPVVKKIIDSVLSQEEYQKYAIEFEKVDWKCFSESSKAFKQLLDILEKDTMASV